MRDQEIIEKMQKESLEFCNNRLESLNKLGDINLGFIRYPVVFILGYIIGKIL